MGGLLHIRSRNMCIVNGVAEVRHSQNIIHGNMITTSFLVLYVIYEFFHITRYYVEERARNNASWQNVLRYNFVFCF